MMIHNSSNCLFIFNKFIKFISEFANRKISILNPRKQKLLDIKLLAYSLIYLLNSYTKEQTNNIAFIIILNLETFAIYII